MRFIAFTTIFIMLALQSFSQKFDPAPGAVQNRLEEYLKRYGTIERVFLDDPQKKTFIAKPGKEYFTWVIFETKFTGVRRMMVTQLGVHGEKVKIHYPKFNQAVTDGYNQAFVITYIAPADASGNINYKVDASPEATIYIYELTRGFKRD